jgi:hypothetical protein
MSEYLILVLLYSALTMVYDLMTYSSIFGLYSSPNFYWSTTFRKPALLPSSGKGKHLICWLLR